MQPTPAIMDRSAQVAHGIYIRDINGREGCLATAGLDAVIQVFKPTCGLCHSDNVKFLRKLKRQSCAKPTRGASDENGICHMARHGGKCAAGQGGRRYSAAFI
jgi:hypothetical protein